MATEGLIQYIQEKVNQGYNPASIRSFLLGQGYPENQINDAFAYLEPRKREIPLIKVMSLLMFVIGAGLMVVASLQFVGQTKEVTPDLDIKTTLVTDVYESGVPLKLNVDIQSSTKVPETITLRYKVSDSDGKTVFYKDEQVNVLKKKTFNRGVNLPEGLNLAGDYTLDTEASVGDKAFISSFEFKIKETQTETRFEVKKETTSVKPKDPTVPEFFDISVSDVARMEGA